VAPRPGTGPRLFWQAVNWKSRRAAAVQPPSLTVAKKSFRVGSSFAVVRGHHGVSRRPAAVEDALIESAI